MADTGPDAPPANDGANAPKSSILGQAPFKLDLRVTPRPPRGGRIADTGRVKPVDRDLLPEPEPAPPPAPPRVEAPARPQPQLETHAPAAMATVTDLPAPMATAVVDPPAPPRPAETVAMPTSGPAAAAPVATTPMAARPIAAGQLTLANVSPTTVVAAPKPIDFQAILGPSTPTAKKRRRNPVGVLFKLALLGAVIAGGVWAAKKYVFGLKWQKDVEVFADDVAERRGLEWKDSVTVEVIEPDAYALQLATSALGLSASDVAAAASEWRALGLAEGEVDLLEIGRAATPDQPAFYDPASGKIYEVAGLTREMSAIVLSRALTTALLDQHFDWSARLVGADAGARLAIRALHDGDAASIQARATLDTLIGPSQVQTVSDEIGALRTGVAAATSEAPPYAVALAGPAADATVYLFPDELTNLERNRAVQAAVRSDAGLFDLVRGPDSEPASLDVAGSKSVGMMYWYYALAGRIGSDAAWPAALAWNGDATVVERSLTSYCVHSTIATFDTAGREALLAALQMWAAAAPPASQTTVESSAPDRIEVSACDPGVDADTMTTSDIRVFGGAPEELASAAALVTAGMDSTPEARACVVEAVRAGTHLAMTDSSGLDPSLVRPWVDLDDPAAQLVLESCTTPAGPVPAG